MKYSTKTTQAIVEAYVGVEEKKGSRGKHRHRVFMWEDGPNIMIGNAPAFANFLGISWSTVHAVLRQHGHTLWNSPKIGRGDIVNEFIAPEPEAEIIGHVPEIPAAEIQRPVDVILKALNNNAVERDALMIELERALCLNVED